MSIIIVYILGAAIAQSVKRQTRNLGTEVDSGSSPSAADLTCYMACILGQDTLPEIV